jgi:hypothetical protein
LPCGSPSHIENRSSIALLNWLREHVVRTFCGKSFHKTAPLGCTQSGKTVWMKSLLENAQKTISPPPQRIIWCYGQWQPSYFDMMRTMPGIEFNQGIPDDIDSADYLDVSQRNLIILDDLMAQCHNPPKMNVFLIFLRKEVIIEICPSSILFKIYSIRAMRWEISCSLNAHYIVLFKSPRDKQQISMLATQVNPGRVQEFMRSYEDATNRPHGYLMLDLNEPRWR